MTSIYEEREDWKFPLLASLAFHVLLVAAAFIGGFFAGPTGHAWGGDTSGGAVQVNMVNAVPLPTHTETTDNILANDSKGITQSVPQKIQEEQDAIPIPDKNAKQNQKKTAVTQAPDIHRPIPPPIDNRVPYGQGGAVNVSYGEFTRGNVHAAFNFEGDFGERFSYYVTLMKNKIYNAWHPEEVGAGAQGHKAFVSFDISKDGTPGNIRLEQTSSIPALDLSATRALERIDTFGRLPDGYSGSYLHVKLWFEPQK